MRNSTLLKVRNMVKAEVGKSLQSTSTAQDPEINQVIDNVQSHLGSSYDWAFLKSRWDSSLNAGARFQTFPTTLSPQGGAAATTAVINFDRPPSLQVKWNQIWQPVVYGIDEIPEFNYLDSDRQQVLDPIQRWQFSDETQFEVWPMPASAAQIRFVGSRQLRVLTTYNLLNETGSPLLSEGGANLLNENTRTPAWNDLALLDLDDLLVTYFVAAEYAMREKKSNYQLLLERAQRRLMSLLGAYPNRTEPIVIGRGQPLGRKAIRQIPLVMIAGNTH